MSNKAFETIKKGMEEAIEARLNDGAAPVPVRPCGDKKCSGLVPLEPDEYALQSVFLTLKGVCPECGTMLRVVLKKEV